MKLYKNMLKFVDIAIEIPYYLLPSEYDFTCFSCGYNVNKRKNELSKIQRKKINFINRLKYAEQKKFCICIDLYKIYEDDDYDEKYKV